MSIVTIWSVFLNPVTYIGLKTAGRVDFKSHFNLQILLVIIKSSAYWQVADPLPKSKRIKAIRILSTDFLVDIPIL